MREIRFRQRIKGRIGEDYWHYWGYDVGGHEFVQPLSKVEWDERLSHQYTGLKDKNGKEIYEGDIVIADGTKADVFYTQRYCAFELRATGNAIGFYKDIEVIGNIYENPELLKE